MNKALTMKRTRKQIEAHISKCAESIQKNGLEIGRDLIEIRDEELWADEYDSWNQYLKERATELVGKTWAASAKLIQCAEIVNKMPSSINVYTDSLDASHIRELGRIAPNDGTDGTSKDYSKLKKKDVERVLRNAKQDNGSVSVRSIRDAVDKELGIDRANQAQQTKKQRQQELKEKLEALDKERELHRYLGRETDHIRQVISTLEEVSVAGWEWLGEHKPGVAERLAKACDDLAEFLRS
jgi:hypothetical protein